MLLSLVRRVAALVPVLIVVTLVVFVLMALMPGDAAQEVAGGQNATPEQIDRAREELHLDEPLVVQYGRWVADAARLDFGESYVHDVEIFPELQRRFPITLSIVISAAIVGVLVGVPLGFAASTRAGGVIDAISRGLSTLTYAIPSFVLAIVLVAVFAVRLRWLPPTGFTPIGESLGDWARSVVLPAVSLGMLLAGSVARQLRTSMLHVLDANYVRTAWAKGAPPRVVFGKHALKNAAAPVATVLGTELGLMIGGAVVVESIFSVQGVGTYILTAIVARDVPVILAVTVLLVIVQMLIGVLLDVLAGALDPRVRAA